MLTSVSFLLSSFGSCVSSHRSGTRNATCTTARPISRSETLGDQAGERMATSGWDSPEIMRVSSITKDLTLSSIPLSLLLQVHQEVAPTALPAGQTNRLRRVANSKAIIGAHPAEVRVVAGGVAGEKSPIIMTAMATLLLTHAALVVVVPAVSSCESCSDIQENL